MDKILMMYLWYMCAPTQVTWFLMEKTGRSSSVMRTWEGITAKKVQKKTFQIIPTNYFSCVKSKMFNFPLKVPGQLCNVWKLLDCRRWRRSSGYMGTQLLGLPLHEGTEGLLQLTSAEGFLVHFMACVTLCRLSQPQLESLSSSSVLTPPWQHRQIRRKPSLCTSLVVQCLHSAATCWANTDSSNSHGLWSPDPGLAE